MFDFKSNAFRNITSVGDRQTHFGYRMPQQLNRRKAETSRIPLFLCASAQKQGDSIISHWVRVFAHRKRENPSPSLGKYVRNPFPRERVSCGCLFWYLFSSEDEKSTPQSESIQPKTSFQLNQIQTYPTKSLFQALH